MNALADFPRTKTTIYSVREFTGVQKFVRKNIYIYIFLRKLAPFICRHFDLEEGFSFLSLIQPKKDCVAIDIGSNDGTSIALISKHVKPVTVACFDPIRAPIVPSSKKVRVSYFPFGLSEKGGKLRFYTPAAKGFRFSQYSSTEKVGLQSQIQHDLGLKPEMVSLDESDIEVRPLDDFNLEPFFMKIDVEGMEFKVLKGSSKTIQKCLPILLVEIQNQESYMEISVYLKSLGYRNLAPASQRFRDWNYVGLQKDFSTRYNNYLWLPIEPSPTWAYK